MDKWADSETFDDYTKTLILECESNREQPANLTWTVPMDAPNTLYYQVVSTILSRFSTSCLIVDVFLSVYVVLHTQ